MRFFLGTHHPAWLGRLDVALFVSDRQLRNRRSFPRARGVWALDSGGFTELKDHGEWSTTTVADYIGRVRRYRDEVGGLEWAAPMDWMCEPVVIAGGIVDGQRFVGTKLSVPEHQARTVANFLELRFAAPDLPFIPVLQGWTLADYLRCVDLYTAAGIDLSAQQVVGVGSVCRRQATGEAARIITALTTEVPGIRLHGFGIKTAGLSAYGRELASSDSLAWSYGARKRGIALPGCTAHKNCANCPRYALRWRDRVIAGLPTTSVRPAAQLSLFDLEAAA